MDPLLIDATELLSDDQVPPEVAFVNTRSEPTHSASLLPVSTVMAPTVGVVPTVTVVLIELGPHPLVTV